MAGFLLVLLAAIIIGKTADGELAAWVRAKLTNDGAGSGARPAWLDQSAAVDSPTGEQATRGRIVHPLPSGRVTSRYGMRTHPVTGKRRQHTGLDLAAPTGTVVRAWANGTVRQASWAGGYGKLLVIDHDGALSSWYAHLSAFDAVDGQQVKAGQAIGRVGSTGNSTGPHLHFEIRKNDRHLNPENFLTA